MVVWSPLKRLSPYLLSLQKVRGGFASNEFQKTVSCCLVPLMARIDILLYRVTPQEHFWFMGIGIK